MIKGYSGNTEEQDQEVEVTDELLLSSVGRNKIRKIFRTADENGHILVSIIKRSRFFPPKVSADQFVKVFTFIVTQFYLICVASLRLWLNTNWLS